MLLHIFYQQRFISRMFRKWEENKTWPRCFLLYVYCSTALTSFAFLRVHRSLFAYLLHIYFSVQNVLAEEKALFSSTKQYWQLQSCDLVMRCSIKGITVFVINALQNCSNVALLPMRHQKWIIKYFRLIEEISVTVMRSNDSLVLLIIAFFAPQVS